MIIGWHLKHTDTYHTNRDCPLLRRHQYRQYKGRKVDISQADVLTKYTCCEYCQRKDRGEEYFAVSNNV